jgi:hypothetical protein
MIVIVIWIPCSTSKKKSRRIKLDTVETLFVREVARCIMTHHKRNEDIIEELGVTDICTVIKNYPKKVATVFENNAKKTNPYTVLSI